MKSDGIGFVCANQLFASSQIWAHPLISSSMIKPPHAPPPKQSSMLR